MLHFTIPLNNPLSALTAQSQGIKGEMKAEKVRKFRKSRCLLAPGKMYRVFPQSVLSLMGREEVYQPS